MFLSEFGGEGGYRSKVALVNSHDLSAAVPGLLSKLCAYQGISMFVIHILDQISMLTF
jgi:hypothetical protein